VADYHDALINKGLRQDTYYWMPFARSTPLFYYNKEKWEAAGLPDRGPATWDEFIEWADLLVERDGDQMTTSAFAHPDGASYIAWLFQGVAWQFNGAYSDSDFTMRMTDENTIAAGQFYHDTVHKYGWAAPSKDLSADFVNGFVASAMMSTGSMGGIRNNAPFEFGTAFLPEKDAFGCSTGGAGLSILTSAPEETRAACMRYIAFVSNPEQTTFWAQSTEYMPVRKSAQESPDMLTYFEEFPQFKTATEQLPLTRAQDVARVFVPNGDQIIGRGLERITVQSDNVAVAFGDVQRILDEEAAPVVEQLRAVEG
jgi:sn-glycerol 3-phosphate transport system substrate-binding protein